jgi:hypothetical protein
MAASQAITQGADQRQPVRNRLEKAGEFAPTARPRAERSRRGFQQFEGRRATHAWSGRPRDRRHIVADKSSDCPTCPQCESARVPTAGWQAALRRRRVVPLRTRASRRSGRSPASRRRRFSPCTAWGQARCRSWKTPSATRASPSRHQRSSPRSLWFRQSGTQTHGGWQRTDSHSIDCKTHPIEVLTAAPEQLGRRQWQVSVSCSDCS